MTKCIWKEAVQSFPHAGRFEVPRGSKFLSAREQGEHSVGFWFECDPREPATDCVDFALVETGKELPTNMRYLGVAMFEEGSYVLHAYVEEVTS